MEHVSSPSGPIRISSTDWLKIAGVIAFLADHIGLYFVDDPDLLRTIGRLAAPIFFFFIGFARSRDIPLSWIVIGSLLTFADFWTDTDEDVVLNILINFAFVRFALRVVDVYAATPIRLAGVALICIVALPFVGSIMEYGAEGWLWALVGYAQRSWRDGDARYHWARFGFAALAAGLYAFTEIQDHGLSEGNDISLIVALLSLVSFLLMFQRRPSPVQPPAILMPIVQFLSRYSLEIYALSLVGMQVIAHVIL
ncbi:MAG: hypothetical protein FGM26_03985 [Beijerinckiaceae bacterium]|nr:hypothetical protein [Beijerinckiaceae bacterium]